MFLLYRIYFFRGFCLCLRTLAAHYVCKLYYTSAIYSHTPFCFRLFLNVSIIKMCTVLRLLSLLLLLLLFFVLFHFSSILLCSKCAKVENNLKIFIYTSIVHTMFKRTRSGWKISMCRTDERCDGKWWMVTWVSFPFYAFFVHSLCMHKNLYFLSRQVFNVKLVAFFSVLHASPCI